MLGLQLRIKNLQPNSQDFRLCAGHWRSGWRSLICLRLHHHNHCIIVTTTTPASVLGRRCREKDDMDNDLDVRPLLNSVQVGPSTSHSAISLLNSMLIMQVTTFDKRSSEGLIISHNVVNELWALNDIRFV